MTLATYLLYLAAVALLIATPGPTMLMCISNALIHGPARAMGSVAGALTASFAVMCLSALGLGALLATSVTAFTIVKVAGALYLIWLGIRTFRSREIAIDESGSGKPRSLFLQGLLVGISNPKAVLFFAAFFPQFIDAGQPFLPQFAILAITFLAGDALVMTVCAMSVGRLAPWLRSTTAVCWINRVCGGLFALLGGLLLFSRRQA
jgi:threonine/homoserine/homoserine lactone efflux protein